MTENYGRMFSSFFLLALLAFTGYLMVVGQSVLLPFVIAIVVWRAVVAMTEAIHQRKIGMFQPPYWLSALIVFGVLFYLILKLGRICFVQFGLFVERLPTYQSNLIALLNTLPPSLLQQISGSNSGNVEEILTMLSTQLFDALSAYTGTLASSAVSILSQASVVLVYVIFLLLEQKTLAEKLPKMFPKQSQQTEVAEILHSIGDNITAYVGLKSLISALLGMAIYISLFLLGVEYALVWALLSFVLNFIPFIGPIVAIVFPVLMALLTFTNWTWIIAVTVIVSVIQMLFGYWVEPKMMSNRLSVSTLVVMLSLSIFGAIWGITGMFLSIPLVVILMIIFGHFEKTRPIAVLLSENGEVPG